MFKTRKTYRILSMLMAFIMLFSTSGLTLDLHYCQGKIKRINLIGKAKTCAEIQSKKTVCHRNSDKQQKSHCSSDSDHNGCCNNASVSIDMDVDFPFITTDLRSGLTDLYLDYQSVVIPTTEHKTFCHFKVYRPPPLPRQNLQVLLQQFLI